MSEFDATDRRILAALQKDGRMTNADLSDAANLSPSACHRRVQRLEAEGIIAAYVALLDDVFGRHFKAIYSSAGNTADLIRDADMVIGAVLIPGAAAPKLISRAQLATMKQGAVLVDVAIDQGGCFETSRATTHQDPIYEVDGIMHYCVANMPGAVARTSTLALGNATLPFLLALADKGWKQACADDPHLLAGLNVHAGHLTYDAVGTALGLEVMAPARALAA